jgi:hypothetical protein
VHPKPFDPNVTPSRVILDVLRHDDSLTVLKGPDSSQTLKTKTVQRERLKGGKTGEDSHRQFNAGWKTGRPWLDFRKVTTTDLDSAGNSVLVTAMFCKWCEMAGIKHNDRGRQCGRALAGGARLRDLKPPLQHAQGPRECHSGRPREWIDPSAPSHPMLVSEACVTGGDSFKKLVEQMKSGVSTRTTLMTRLSSMSWSLVGG